MTRTHVPPVLVTGGTGRVGSAVVGLLVDAGVPVRVLTRRSEAAATLPADVEVVSGDLTVPESLDAALRGVRNLPGSSREWHREVAVGSAGFGWRSAREVGGPDAEVLRFQRQLLRIDALLAGPG